MLRRLLRQVKQVTMPRSTSNFAYNQKRWDRYARRWSRNKRRWARAPQLYVEDPQVTRESLPSYLTHLGDEWGTKADVDRIVDEYILPYVTAQSVVAEIGVGGARIASRVVMKPKELWCFDVSRQMLKRARSVLSVYPHARFVRLEQPRFPDEFEERFDFVYSFDVFVHLDLHTIWKYLNEIRRMLKTDGKAFVHVSNLTTPGSWERFAAQDHYSVEGFYFISPEIADLLIKRSGLKKVRTSVVDPTNFYLNRDYMVILQKDDRHP